jgi:hypothetical protein
MRDQRPGNTLGQIGGQTDPALAGLISSDRALSELTRGVEPVDKSTVFGTMIHSGNPIAGFPGFCSTFIATSSVEQHG